MKKILLSMMFVLGMSTSGMAYFVGGVDVGEVDYKLAAAYVNSGYASELAWVNLNVSPDYTSFVKYDGDGDNPAPWTWTYVNGSTSIVAANLANAPDYYFIKIGTGNLGVGNGQNAIDHYLFRNDTSNTWAVVNLDTSFDSTLYDITLLNNGGIGRFSHEGGFGENPVPEPGTMVLLGAGMLGLVIFGKRRMNRD